MDGRGPVVCIDNKERGFESDVPRSTGISPFPEVWMTSFEVANVAFSVDGTEVSSVKRLRFGVGLGMGDERL